MIRLKGGALTCWVGNKWGLYACGSKKDGTERGRNTEGDSLNIQRTHRGKDFTCGNDFIYGGIYIHITRAGQSRRAQTVVCPLLSPDRSAVRERELIWELASCFLGDLRVNRSATPMHSVGSLADTIETEIGSWRLQLFYAQNEIMIKNKNTGQCWRETLTHIPTRLFHCFVDELFFH